MENFNKSQVKCPAPVTVLDGLCSETIERTWPGSFIMSRRIEYKKGEKIGACIFIADAKYKLGPSGRKIRMAKFACLRCGKHFNAIVATVKNGDTRSCGCLQTESRTKHGLIDHPLYNRWKAIKRRCLNQKSDTYLYYGGRGISIHSKWINDFKSFYDYVIALPNAMQPGMTIDRIDNDCHYEPGNIRWADRHLQSINQRKQKNTTGYTGVYRNKNKYCFQITVHGKVYTKNTFNTIKEAAIARDRYIIDNELTGYKLQVL